ncbi:hypothetical protein SNOG_12782 [Parastagonospora nodorum SN15]|uniref:Uncharacterized protein n=1 Tax=Phaeosphaeria nodorum (strain SN15 / ATCC MYA-4574 / FGSC 10173) TaxID=321614 RepID=Q0U632_PHANO|nr:hypothetical protein SNOG_12782 [Parastagonospora nodorum SN15]EAT80080.1 hypothetical protein SNOG_12782 [Parastagonospora nodorum SN15]
MQRLHPSVSLLTVDNSVFETGDQIIRALLNKNSHSKLLTVRSLLQTVAPISMAKAAEKNENNRQTTA